LWALFRTVSFATCVALASLACDSGPEVTPASTFDAEDVYARTVSGRVLAGTEPVAGALVRIDARAAFVTDARLNATTASNALFPRTDTTNAAGAYRFAFGPVAYDLSIRTDAELIVFNELGVRGFQATLGYEATPSGFAAEVVPSIDPPARPGNAVVYFVSGAEARSLGAGPRTREVRFRHFESTLTLHAVEYVAMRGPAAAVAEGSVEIIVRDGAVVTPTVPMRLVPTMSKVTFAATPPPGFKLVPLDVEMDLGLRTSAVPVTRVLPGVPLEITIVTGARYAVHARAVAEGGAATDSGRFLFDPLQAEVVLKLPPPISAEAPIDDDAIATGMASSTLGPATLDAGGVLAARLGKGVVEHVLAPESGAGPVIRVVTSSRTTTLPDATAFGLARPVGRHVWTLQHFPTLPRVGYLGGEDGRIGSPSWTSRPRVIVVR
jgi:hypothetical protein